MKSTPLLVHVGYHKTATTWLQKVVFRPENGFLSVMSHAEIFDLIVRPHGLDFDDARARELLHNRSAAGQAGSVDVLSLESLSGSPFSGGQQSDEYARRLVKIAPDAKILITIREQVKIISSVYMQYVLRGGTEPPEVFFAGNQVEAFQGFCAKNFEYDRLVARYQHLFGPENVLVLPHETIAGNQANAVKILAGFAGNSVLKDWADQAPTGASYPEVSAAMLRRANHFRSTPLNRSPLINLGRFGDFGFRLAGATGRRLFRKSRRPITRIAAGIFSDQFADSNRRLLKMVGHPIKLPGYQGIDGNDAR